MTGTPTRSGNFLERLLPEQRIFIKSDADERTRYLCLSPKLQALALGCVGLGVVWTVATTSALLLGQLAADGAAMQARVIQDAQDARITELSSERDQRAREAAAMRERFSVALSSISDFQTQLLSAQKDRDELTTALELMREKLQNVVADHALAEETAELLTAEVEALSGALQEDEGRTAELTETVAAVSGALSRTVDQRDANETMLSNMQDKVASMEFEARVEADRNDRMYSDLETAVAVTMGPLKRLLETTGQDVEALVDKVKQQYSGEGGPFVPTSFSGGVDDEAGPTRYAALMQDLDRVHLMQIASTQIPFAHPVRGAVRYTSSFGKRRDPFNGRLRDHKGQDLAAPSGTPILASADGVVTFAGTSGGYGKMVKIRHSFGYETLYAHLKDINVAHGDSVARGDVIGGMGNTGRSTGTHLHYEIRIEGQAVNPMPYMKAAKDVF